MPERKNVPKPVADRLLVDAMNRCCMCPEHHDVVDMLAKLQAAVDAGDLAANGQNVEAIWLDRAWLGAEG